MKVVHHVKLYLSHIMRKPTFHIRSGLEILMLESVDGWMHAGTDGCSSPILFSSGELEIILFIITKTVFKRIKAQLDLHPIFPRVLTIRPTLLLSPA